jgi:hypothetical protein
LATGYKIRLGDGSEIGPMDLEAVKDWYRQGLLGLDSPVLTPRGGRWIPLKHAIPGLESSPAAASYDLRAAVMEASRSKSHATGRRTARPVATVEDRDTQPWRTTTGGILLLLAATGAAFWLLYPDRWIAALDIMPWREVILGTAALGLVLVRGWDLARKLVRVALVLVAVALFPAAGILIVQKVPLTALAVVGSGLVFLAGLILWLAAGRLSVLRVILSAFVVLAGAAGVVRFGLIPQRPELQQIQHLALAERALGDRARGMWLTLPDSWVALKKEQDLVPVGEGSVLVLGEPRRGGLAVVSAVTPRHVLTTEEFLDRTLRDRNLPERMEDNRGDVVLGELSGRQAESHWERDGTRYRDVTVVARDGPTYWSLAAWMPDDGSTRPAEVLEALVSGFSLDGKMGAQLREAVSTTFRALPFLTPVDAEAVIVSMGEAAPGPYVVFHQALQLETRGRSLLSEQEIADLETIDRTLEKQLSRNERRSFRLYVSRISQQVPTTPEDDRAMAELLRRAVLSLPAPYRTRLQELYEKAIVAALG